MEFIKGVLRDLLFYSLVAIALVLSALVGGLVMACLTTAVRCLFGI